MRNPGINGEELKWQPANPGSPGKMAVKMECVCMHVTAPSQEREIRAVLHGSAADRR